MKNVLVDTLRQSIFKFKIGVNDELPNCIKLDNDDMLFEFFAATNRVCSTNPHDYRTRLAVLPIVNNIDLFASVHTTLLYQHKSTNLDDIILQQQILLYFTTIYDTDFCYSLFTDDILTRLAHHCLSDSTVWITRLLNK